MKSTFQKPDATYPHGSLREQPETFNWMDVETFNRVTNSARVIPCSENNWKDGQEYEQDVDYKLEEKETKEIEDFSGSMNVPCYKTKLFAVPIVAQETEESQDDIWDSVRRDVSENLNYMWILKSKYLIKRKQ